MRQKNPFAQLHVPPASAARCGRKGCRGMWGEEGEVIVRWRARGGKENGGCVAYNISVTAVEFVVNLRLKIEFCRIASFNNFSVRRDGLSVRSIIRRIISVHIHKYSISRASRNTRALFSLLLISFHRRIHPKLFRP